MVKDPPICFGNVSWSLVCDQELSQLDALSCEHLSYLCTMEGFLTFTFLYVYSIIGQIYIHIELNSLLCKAIPQPYTLTSVINLYHCDLKSVAP